jgi:hypothetical protein
MDNTDFGLAWRKEMTRVYVRRTLEELRARRASHRTGTDTRAPEES